MALRLTCNRLMRVASGKSMALRSFAAAAEESASTPGAAAPSVFDKIISLTVVDPSGARRKINGMVGELVRGVGIVYLMVLEVCCLSSF